MVAWYPFDEPDGPASSANLATQNTGTWHGGLEGSLLGGGYILQSLWFDGSTGYVESPSSIATNFGPANASPCGGVYSSCSGDFSTAVWINTSTSQYATIFDKRSFDSSGRPHGYLLMLWGNGLLLQLADGGPAYFGGYNWIQSAPTGVNLADGHWHFVAVTVSRSPAPGYDVITFYFDYPNFPSQTQIIAGRERGTLVNTSPLRIGAQNTGSGLGSFFSGSMDELQMWNRVLTPGATGEVAAIHNAGSYGVCKY
jgi:hypothetical protein